MPTVAHPSPMQQASNPLGAAVSGDRVSDRHCSLLLHQTAWAIQAAPASWDVRVHLEGRGLYAVCNVDEDPPHCVEPPEHYEDPPHYTEPPEHYQVRSRRAGHWCWLNNVVIDHHARLLGPEALALYVCLARHAGNTTEQCWPTIPRMAQGTGMSRNRVRKALKRLYDYGLISLEEQTFARYGKVWRGYLITLLDPNPLAVSLRQRSGELISPPHGGARRRRQGRAVTPTSEGHRHAAWGCKFIGRGVQLEGAWGCNLPPKPDFPNQIKN